MQLYDSTAKTKFLYEMTASRHILGNLEIVNLPFFSMVIIFINYYMTKTLDVEAKKSLQESVLNLKNTVENYYDFSVKSHLEGSASIVRDIVENEYSRVMSSEITQTELYAILSEKFKYITVEESGYPVVVDYTGKLIIHPSLEGKDSSKLQDPDGKFFVKEMLEKKLEI